MTQEYSFDEQSCLNAMQDGILTLQKLVSLIDKEGHSTLSTKELDETIEAFLKVMKERKEITQEFQEEVKEKGLMPPELNGIVYISEWIKICNGEVQIELWEKIQEYTKAAEDLNWRIQILLLTSS